jgi:hypothetical protein
VPSTPASSARPATATSNPRSTSSMCATKPLRSVRSPPRLVPLSRLRGSLLG